MFVLLVFVNVFPYGYFQFPFFVGGAVLKQFLQASLYSKQSLNIRSWIFLLFVVSTCLIVCFFLVDLSMYCIHFEGHFFFYYQTNFLLS